MCGICGQYNFRTGRPVLEPGLRRMASSIAHRGPDDEGYFAEGPVGFGFRRLSIIDLAAGHQPMATADGGVILVFNGEIFNYRELRAELAAAGRPFRTSSDTEVVLQAYAQWGMDFLSRLRGMFGLAVWDRGLRRLVLARDRFGVKGLYYRLDGEGILFGSEIRPVLEALETAPGVDATAVKLFLKYRYAPAPLTAYEGIRKLAAGECLVVEEGRERIFRYYRRPPGAVDRGISPDEAAEELARLYRDAVRSQLVADVPVGLLLSGGVDSALLLALMSEAGKDWRSYSVGFGEAYPGDELEDARRTALAFGSLHEEVRLTRSDFEELLPKAVASLEEPIASASIVPMYAVCRTASRGVKVALSGQGPDEVWGGYVRHLGIRYSAAWRSLPRPLRALAGAAGRLSGSETLRRGLASLAEPDRVRRYERVFALAPERSIDALFKPGLAGPDSGRAMLGLWSEVLPDIEGLDELGGFQLLETRFSLPDELLMYSDKLSMAHGLELRVPYLDQAVVEFAERLPMEMKVGGGARKRLHRAVARRFLPEEVIRRKKRAFASDVVGHWFKSSLEGRLSGYLLDPGSRIYSFLDREAVTRTLEAHRSGRGDYYKILFSIVVLEEWLRSAGGKA